MYIYSIYEKNVYIYIVKINRQDELGYRVEWQQQAEQWSSRWKMLVRVVSWGEWIKESKGLLVYTNDNFPLEWTMSIAICFQDVLYAQVDEPSYHRRKVFVAGCAQSIGQTYHINADGSHFRKDEPSRYQQNVSTRVVTIHLLQWVELFMVIQ